MSPGIVSQLVDGLDGMLRMPSGCFEQTSSTTYPNVLVLDYMKNSDQLTPEIQMQAEQYIAQGYQRLLTFEVPGGGFSLFGQAPAQPMLTAYGLMEFADMSTVYYVDPELIERTAVWLMGLQKSDGSWAAEGLTIESGWEKLVNSDLPVTAFTVWALIEAGYEDTQAVQDGLSYLREFVDLEDDTYSLALIASALAAGDPDGGLTQQVLSTLDGRKTVEEDRVYWTTAIPSYMGGSGSTANIETTAMIAYAMLQADAYPETVNGALNFLVAQKDSFGTWQTTQSTILALKTLLYAAVKGGEGGEDVTVRVSLNGEATEPIHITAANSEVVHLISFSDKAALGENQVRLDLEGQRALMYQVIAEYYVPWSEIPEPLPLERAVDIQVTYDRAELAVNDLVQVQVRAELLVEGSARQTILDLGLPPGFVVQSEDLDALVEQGTISRYELAGRQIIVYVEGFSSKKPVEFSYHLRAKYPLRAQAPASQAYDYYAPERQGSQSPTIITVNG